MSKKPSSNKKAAGTEVAVVNQNALSTEVRNSLGDVVTGLSVSGLYQGAQLSQTATLVYNLRNYLISNNRQLLSQTYVEHGIVQTLIDQPVDDAFRAGMMIETDQLDPAEIEELEQYMERNHIIEDLKEAMKWTRLYGGGGLLIITPDDPVEPFNPDSIKENTPIKFKACDLWELYMATPTSIGEASIKKLINEDFYYYYGIKVHPSRVIKLVGKRAPSFIRPRLRGWGMSEVERLIRSINQYLKNQVTLFELLDEAKIDVYKIQGFTAGLANKGGAEKTTQRIQLSAQIKNTQNALVMDKNDDYEQKVITFSGLSDVIDQIRQSLAADVKMPLTKLFGVSSAGFNSGEDDIENYNAMIEGEIRSQCKYAVIKVMEICCQKLFGFIPDDLQIRFNPLRVLSAEEEENVKEKQFNRVVKAYELTAIDMPELIECINQANLLPIRISDKKEGGDLRGSLFNPSNGDDETGEN